jgi:hypothetical protein
MNMSPVSRVRALAAVLVAVLAQGVFAQPIEARRHSAEEYFIYFIAQQDRDIFISKLYPWPYSRSESAGTRTGEESTEHVRALRASFIAEIRDEFDVIVTQSNLTYVSRPGQSEGDFNAERVDVFVRKLRGKGGYGTPVEYHLCEGELEGRACSSWR